MPSQETNTYLAWTLPLTAVLSAIAGVLVYKYASMPSTSTTGFQIPGVGTLITDTITYIPHILLLFGVLADMFTYRGVYSIASLVGLIGIPVNSLFSYFWAGLGETIGKIAEVIAYKPTDVVSGEPGPVVLGGAIREYDGCNVQGFGSLASSYAPQTLVVTASVFSYYMFDLIGNRGWLAATATIVLFAVSYFAQTYIIGACNAPGATMSLLMKSLMALTEGLFVGGVSYSVVQNYFPGRLPSTALPTADTVSAASLTKRSDGTLVDSSGTVYMALPDGSAIPVTAPGGSNSSTPGAGTVSGATGSGTPATPAECTGASCAKHER